MLRLLPYAMPSKFDDFSWHGESYYLHSMRLALLAICQNTKNDRLINAAIQYEVLFLDQFVILDEDDPKSNLYALAS